MRCICKFFECSRRVIIDSQKSEKKISMALILTAIEKPFLELSQMKFKDPRTPKQEILAYFDNLCDEIENEFRKLVLG